VGGRRSQRAEGHRPVRSRATDHRTPGLSEARTRRTSTDTDGGLAAFYVVAGIAVAAVSLITNYEYNPARTCNEPVRVQAA
jgi:hypothetical protein